MHQFYIPDGYRSKLSLRETEAAIKDIKDYFQIHFSKALNLSRVSAPLFVDAESGLNDNLNGTERPVDFDVLEQGEKKFEIVHSLAKWKRMALKRYGFDVNEGLYTDMNAIRRDETTDSLHSIYVDQWDWERIISPEERNTEYLHKIVRDIFSVLRDTEEYVVEKYGLGERELPDEITFVTTQELEDAYPELAPSERENIFAKKYGAIFLGNIGGKLRSGKIHDGRAPDYDDWNLNGDIIVYNKLLKRAFEISSMGIRVNAESLKKQLVERACMERESLPFHKAVLNDELPLTIGGGIGQSRLCMLFLRKAHVGEVQASVWPQDEMDYCAERCVELL